MLFGKWKKEKRRPGTYKDTWSYTSLKDLPGCEPGTQEDITKSEKRQEKKQEIIAGKKKQESKDHMKEVYGRLEALEREAIFSRLKISWIKEQVKLQSQMSTSVPGADTTEHLRDIKNSKQDTEIGRQKYTLYGENQIWEKVGNAREKRAKEPIGRPEMNGGTVMKDKKTSSLTTSIAGYHTTSSYDCWTDTPWTYKQKEDTQDLWPKESGSLATKDLRHGTQIYWKEHQ